MSRGPEWTQGVAKLPPELRRSEVVRVSCRPGEMVDLETISRAWGVPPSTAAWAIVASYISDCRSEALTLGEHTLGIAACCKLGASMRVPGEGNSQE